MTAPTELEREVRSLTVSPNYRPIAGDYQGNPPGLRVHPGPVRVGTTVWIHASGYWRPSVVEKVTSRQGVETYHVVHSSPSNPHRLYRKRAKIDDLRARA